MADLPKTQNNFIRFLSYVRPYKWQVVAASIGGIVKFSVPLIVPQITRYLLDDVFLSTTLTNQQKINDIIVSVGGLIAVFIFFWTPLTYIRQYYAGKSGYLSVDDLRHELYYRILRMSASFFDRHKSGGIVQRLVNDIDIAQNLVGSALTNVWMDLISLILIAYFLLTIDFGITVVALITFPFYLYFFTKSQGAIKVSSLQVQADLENMSGNVQEKIAGNRVVRAFGREQHEEQVFQEDAQKLLKTSMWRVYLQSVNLAITGVIVNVAPLLVMLYGGIQVVNGSLTVGSLIAVTMYLPSLYTPLQRFSELGVVFATSMAAVDRVFEVMDMKPEIHDAPDAVDLGSVEGRVEFEHVSFAYHNHEDAEGPVLRDMSFVVEPGEKVALVGPSGSGKSTVVSLIPRFYDVDAGIIHIDGHDVRAVTQASLRRNVGMVLQTPILFSGTIFANIRYGKPDASEAEVIQACQDANAWDFIQRLPKGLYTEVGENGGFLSGGQRQRITIARAFLKDPKILILDEATSALDSESERLIQAALERLMIGRTTFIIAHRLSTIENADLIFVLDRG
ncbi:MAG TPA: ABC transporter ATP-binding protein, partial [Phototrophicaceae bacterium]|nr:ABC transporter ATP-binding protein [Phototrophicaceae bacterium]